MDEFRISYDAANNVGMLRKIDDEMPTSWQKLKTSALNINLNAINGSDEIRLPWFQMLTLLREYLPLQRPLNFRIRTDDTSREQLSRFVSEFRITRTADRTEQAIVEDEVEERLVQFGFTPVKRELKQFQKRDIARLVNLPSGANFSVPGAGKTTVTLAVHLLTCTEKDKLLVICPKSAFPVWSTIISECLEPSDEWFFNNGSFKNLSGLTERDIVESFTSGAHYFMTNYEHFVARRDVYSFLLSTYSVHLVLDEAHRMKAGELSQRGSALLSVANLPKRKDILTGTPMPQSAYDLQAQMDFLYPGSSLGLRIERGEMPSRVIGNLYTRTTKSELGLPPVNRIFIPIPMSEAQIALYTIVKNDALSQLSSLRTENKFDVIKARRSVLRLLQLASNPLLAIRSISQDVSLPDNRILEAITQEGISSKMQAVIRLVRENVLKGRKTVVWTIFTQNIMDLENCLLDLNPVTVFGGVPTGSPNDESTREGRIRKFHEDKTCMVMIANPGAAGEGINLHEVCHEAIYLDRSYISTQYLQSIDRIHRLGLPPDTQTNISILLSAPPPGVGSIDYSVSRRLAAKIRALQQLLDDRDLHEIALDEETVDEPIDYNFEFDDLADLIQELEGQIDFDEDDAI